MSAYPKNMPKFAMRQEEIDWLAARGLDEEGNLAPAVAFAQVLDEGNIGAPEMLVLRGSDGSSALLEVSSYAEALNEMVNRGYDYIGAVGHVMLFKARLLP